MTHYEDRYSFGDAFCDALHALAEGARIHVSAYWDSIGGRTLNIYSDFDIDDGEEGCNG